MYLNTSGPFVSRPVGFCTALATDLVRTGYLTAHVKKTASRVCMSFYNNVNVLLYGSDNQGTLAPR